MFLDSEKTYMLLELLKDLQPEKNYEFNDIGAARLFSKLFSEILRYNITIGKYMYYDDIRWIVDEGNVYASQLAKDMYDVLKLYCATIKDERLYKDFFEFIIKYSNFNKRESLIKDAKSLLMVKQEAFDKNTHLLNCLNCTVDMNTKEPHKHTPSDMLTKVCGCDFNPMADSTVWNKFLDEIMQGDKDRIQYLKRISGIFLTADTSLETAFFLYGPTARNGKSTLLETIGKVLGEYYTPLSATSLAICRNSNGEAPSPQIAKLAGVRLVSISEPPKGMPLNVALLKHLTGGDKITARMLNSNPFDFTPQFKLCFNCNSLPVVADRTLFSSDRVRIIQFNRHFASEERNTHLKEILSSPESLSAVLNWALEGLALFREIGECPPECVLEATKRYKQESDKISKFITACLVQSETNSTGDEIYKIYCQWCLDTGYSVDGKYKFFESLRERKLLQQATVQGKTVKNAVIGYSIAA